MSKSVLLLENFMAIPNFQFFMSPLLKLLADKKEYHLKEVVEILSNQLNFSEEEKKQRTAKGNRFVLYDRIHWARFYLIVAGLLERPKRGYLRITSEGLAVHSRNPDKIDTQYLMQYEEFKNFLLKSRTGSQEKDEKTSVVFKENTPEEIFETAYNELRKTITDELLITVKSCSSSFFERMVIDLLVVMGYGGSRKDAGQAIGKSGDEGIDGVIKEDKLGLDVIYIQAKRWDKGTIGRPEIQKFAGALQGQRAKKGIFITTSNFTTEAREYVKNIESRITLIDGNELAEFMLDNNIGVSPVATYTLHKIDNDYFSEI